MRFNATSSPSGCLGFRSGRTTVQFTFGEEQELFAATLRELLADRCSPSAIRTTWDSPDGRVQGLWEALAETGLLGLLAPESHGGLSRAETDLSLLLEELGRVACPEPVAEHAGVAVPLLRDHGSKMLCDEWLGRAADGSAVLTAKSPTDAMVLAGATADLVVMAVDDAIHAVPSGSFVASAQAGVDRSRRLARLEVDTSAATFVSADPSALRSLLDRGAWVTAAQGVGVVQRLLEMTVAYVTEREQFGRPVGVNQAVKHHCAEVAIALEFSRPLVEMASWALSTERLPEGTLPGDTSPDRGPLPPPSIAVSMAKAAVSDALDLACRSALQCHGAIGYTIEYDLQLWLKRGWALSASWGGARHHRHRIASELGLRQHRNLG